MIDRIHVLIFTPTYDNGLRPETVASIVGQQTHHWLTWEIGRCNPYPGRDMRNVLAQYSYGRELCLNGPYDAMLTVEHDMVLPVHAINALCGTPAPVVYATYMLRHQDPVLNTWQYIGTNGLGMSLDRYPAELRSMAQMGVGRVSGVGFGCTLIRRQVLEAIPFRASPSGHAPDVPFALDCVRKGITQLARFDVRCGHVHEGEIMSVEMNGGAGVKVLVLNSINILVNGGGVSLSAGDTLDLPAKQAKQLVALGHVKLAGPSGLPDPAYAAVSEPAKPKVPRR